MDAQQRAQASLASQGKKKRFSRRTIVITSIIIGIVIATVLSLSSLSVIPGYVAVIITSFGLVFGVIFALLAIIPTDDKNATPVTSSPAPPALLSTSPDKPAPRGIAGFPPPTDPRTIQQREQAVQDIYGRLTQPGTSAVVLTGIGGQGKSTLAALVYRYAETQQRTGHGYFTASPLWLRVDPAVTLADILTNICDALQVRTPDIASLSPENQAFALFNVLNSVDKPRLVVLDQFENVLDDEGRARDRPSWHRRVARRAQQQCLRLPRAAHQPTRSAGDARLSLHLPAHLPCRGLERGGRHRTAAQMECERDRGRACAPL